MDEDRSRHEEPRHVVQGTVTDARGLELSGARVALWWCRIRDRVELAEVRTTEEGTYRLHYRPPDEVDGQFLVEVEAVSERLAAPLTSARTIAAPSLQIDLSAPAADPSEFGSLLGAVTAGLGGLGLTDVVESDEHHDITYLAQETGRPSEQVMRLAVAARAEDASGVPSAVTYAFVALHIPSSLPTALLADSQGFTLIDSLVSHVVTLIANLDPAVQAAALEEALRRRIIAEPGPEQIPAVIATLQSLRRSSVLDAAYISGKASLRDLLTEAGLPADRHVAFSTALTQNTGTMKQFWATLADGRHGFTTEEVASVQLTLSLGAFVKNTLPLVAALRQRFSAGTHKNLADLATLDVPDWVGLIQAAGSGAVPANLVAPAGEDPVAVFAKEVYERVTRTYPTAALASRVPTGEFIPPAQRVPLQNFFQANPSLDLRRENLDIYLDTAGPGALDGIASGDRAAVVGNLRAMQRVLRIVGHVDTCVLLLTVGIDSAAAVSMMGREQFVSTIVAAGASPTDAHKTFDAAARRYAGVVSLWTQFNRGFDGVRPAAFGPSQPRDDAIDGAIEKIPSLAVLFGSQDYCEADFCSSVLSPAAYLTDLLCWLGRRRSGISGGHANALDVFLARRPDVAAVLLNCPNTDTPLPYIDIVNELLEDAVSPGTSPGTRNTTLEAAQLRAAPDPAASNDGAYTVLAAAHYPHALPYDAPLDQLRQTLARSNVALWQVRQSFLPLHAAPTTHQLAVVAAERFGMCAAERQLVVTPDTSPAGLSQVWNTADPVVDLAPVDAFLAAADITYSQLLELTDVTWVRDGGAPSVLQGVDDKCSTSTQTISALDADRLDRIHRFLRLWRRTGWKMWELDLLLASPAVADADAERTLVNLFTIRQIQDRTRLSADQVLALYAPLDTASHRDPDLTMTTPLFAGLFENPAAAPDPHLALANLDGTADLPSHATAISAALQITPADAAMLIGLTDGTRTLANLSLAFRVAAIARALRMTITDALAVGPSPFTGVFASADSTLAFLRLGADIAGSGFNVAQLSYLLTSAPSSVGITQKQVTAVLTDVRRTMQKVHDSIYQAGDPPYKILGKQLAQLPGSGDPAHPSLSDPAQLAQALSIVDGSFTAADPARADFIEHQFGLFMTPAEQAAAVALLVPNASPGTAITDRVQLDPRADAVLAPLARYLTQTEVVAVVAGDLGLATDVTAGLISGVGVPAVPPPGARSLLAALTDPELIVPAIGGPGYAEDLTPANFADQFNSIRLLHKHSVIVGHLHLTLNDLTWLLANATVYGGTDLARLPVIASPAPQPSQPIGSLLATVLVVQLDRAFNTLSSSTASPPPAVPDLFTLISTAATGGFVDDTHAADAVAAISGARPADVQALSTALGLTLAGGDYENPSSFDRLRTLLAMAGATGGSGAALQSWAADGPTPSVAASALQSLASLSSPPSWLARAPELMDPLRERRRDALVAYLTSRDPAAGYSPRPWGTDSDALFSYFLIDVEMSACQDTSRIVQAYAAVQLFVQRCLMNLEGNVIVDPAQDSAWAWWDWMKRYRLWEANRKIFLYPENWLIESDRPNRSEVFERLHHDANSQQNTADNLEAAVLDYIDRLDEIAHLTVTGTCEDALSGVIHVVARSHADPPRFYHRTFDPRVARVWTPWTRIPIDIKAHQVVPAVHRGSLYLFWAQAHMANEPQQKVPAAQATNGPSMSRPATRHVEISLGSSAWKSGRWSSPEFAAGKFYDVPVILVDPVASPTDTSVEALYSIKVQSPATAGQATGSDMLIDVFRFGPQDSGLLFFIAWALEDPTFSDGLGLTPTTAQHIARARFDGRFNTLELLDLSAIVNGRLVSNDTAPAGYLGYAQGVYGPDAEALIELPSSETAPDLVGEPGLIPKAGALMTSPVVPGQSPVLPLTFTSVSGLEQNVRPLLNTAPAPFGVVGPSSDLAFDPTNYFFYEDRKRAYFVESTRYYQNGSRWSPVVPSNPGDVPFEMVYRFHRFYHPYTKLLWHQIFAGGVSAIYNRTLELSPDTVDPGHGDVFSFEATYQPDVGQVNWGEDNEILDFDRDAPYSVYNWELFFHVPLYVAQKLSLDQRFEDALGWFHFIFDPTNPGPDPAPQRYWIPKPLYSLPSATVEAEQINQLLLAVNQGDANQVAAVDEWKANPFNPFLVADQRPVAYMKQTVMAYLDNLLAWGDNLFSTASRESLNQATLLYVLADEILGPQPAQVPVAGHADASFNDLKPHLDDFANAMVMVENVLPPTPGAGNPPGGGDPGAPLPAPEVFYFRIPPNGKLLGYWRTVADRLFKLRHCETITGQPLALPLFDAPIDPGLLAAAEAAGVDLSSVLNDLSAPLPNYRYAYLYGVAQDFTTAVRSYGTQLLAALDKKDADALALLLAGLQQQLLSDADQIFQNRVDEAQAQIDALGEALALQQSRQAFYAQRNINVPEALGLVAEAGVGIEYALIAISYLSASGASLIPFWQIGASGFGGSPHATGGIGGLSVKDAFNMAAHAVESGTKAVEKGVDLLYRSGAYLQRQDDWDQKAAEAGIAAAQVQHQIDAAELRHQIAQQDQADHQSAIDNLAQQIDFLTTKFTNTQLYDWMAATLSATYFQAYQLAYAMAKKAERCYDYELGVTSGAFITFGYWDSLHQGLLAGEGLAADLRRMHSSYLDRNVRRHEISRVYSLAKLDPGALITLLATGTCDFTFPESLFDGDYPGHYQRQLKRVSITVVYPGPGRNDNVTATLTLVHNKVRMVTDLTTNADPYAESPPGTDPRFAYQYGAVQTIVASQAQDDAALFESNVHYQLTDPRYLPFEGAGAISDWHLELPRTNEIDVTTVGDVQVHLLYTALDGGAALKSAAATSTAAGAPTSGTKLFSAVNDFSAPAPSATTPYPVSPWQAFLSPASGDQILTLAVSGARFPYWTRGRTIAVTGITMYATSWSGATFTVEPQGALAGSGPATLTPVGTPALVSQGGITVPPGTKPGTWSFKLQVQGATDWHSLAPGQIGDVVIAVAFSV